MNAIRPPSALQQGAQAFLSRYDGLKAGLPGDPALREAAAELFRAGGLPGAREEAWRYTFLRPVAEVAFHAPSAAAADCTAALCPAIVAAASWPVTFAVVRTMSGIVSTPRTMPMP